ncbi:S-layer homology domain-containing protein [Paenibacillus septentrionalis]|uniref:S-layer homology domain-containing protein n=1 Tax=Paenibacillus septentrionalis TaxID=429342 RepID=A0ABW1V9Z4_9BACL
MKTMITLLIRRSHITSRQWPLLQKPFLLLLIFSVLLSSLATAVPVARAGNDAVPLEESGWVLVGSAEELAYINKNQAAYIDRQIRLTHDIDMTGYEWIPFGDGAATFSGIFDGRGHKIKGVSIDGGSRTNVGFFGRVSGTIQNLGVEVLATGGEYTGGLVGHLFGGSIIRSYSQGSVIGGDNNRIGSVNSSGGLVGGANGDSSIIQSYSTADVKSGGASNQYAGGLVGSQGAGTIENAYATGTVTDTNVGFLYYINIGGLTGQLIYGTVTNSYASGAVTATADPMYTAIGGLIGTFANVQNTSIVSSYFDQMTTLQSKGLGTGNSHEPTGLSTDDMKSIASYGAGWDFINDWAIHSGVNDGYPYLRPVILSEQLPQALKGDSYLHVLEAIDGAGNGLFWSASGVPTGMALSDDGTLTGSPAESGIFQIKVSVIDAGSNVASADLSLIVNELAPDITDFNVAPGNVLGSVNVTATASDQEHAFAYVIGDDAGVRPLLGQPLPSDVTIYSLGSDIADVQSGHILQLYELDNAQHIQAWSSLQLAPSHIQSQIRVAGISLDATELTLVAGGAARKLTATIEPENASNQAVSWTSSDSVVAMVNQSGEVTPVSEGTAVITAMTEDGWHTAYATVTVQPLPEVVGNVKGTVMGTGDTPLSGAKIVVGAVEGSTDAEGNFHLVNIGAGSQPLAITAAGYVEYKATVDIEAGQTVDVGRIDMTLAPIAVTGISLDATELTLVAGGAARKLTATIEPENASNQAVSWTSSNSVVAMVNQSGEVTPVSEGTAVITAMTEDGWHTAYATVTVQPLPPVVGNVTGTVMGTGDTALSGAKIVVGAVEGSTDAEGNFHLVNIGAGSQPLAITAAGYVEYKATVDIEAGQTVDVGRIDMKAVPRPTPNPSYPPASGGEVKNEEMSITINGRTIKVTMAKEQENDGRSVLRLILDAEFIESIFEASDIEEVVLDINNEDPIVKVDFSAEALRVLANDKPHAVIRIAVNGASSSFPLHMLNIEEHDATVTAVIARMAKSDQDELTAALDEKGHTMLAESMSFYLYRDGDMVEVEDTYMERTVSLAGDVNPDHTTVVQLDHAGKPHFVPSVFETGTATFYSVHHGAYTVIASERAFADTEGHWAHKEIELLANKLIINGEDLNSFNPENAITRAEFIAMLVRSLGLAEKPKQATFTDIPSDEVWFAGSVGAASAAGLIEGFEDGAFRPNALVTREQMTVIMGRAVSYAGELPSENVTALERFSDFDEIADWAKASASQLYAAGMMRGVEQEKLAPQAPATRAQSAVLIKRMLEYVEFVNEAT